MSFDGITQKSLISEHTQVSTSKSNQNQASSSTEPLKIHTHTQATQEQKAALTKKATKKIVEVTGAAEKTQRSAKGLGTLKNVAKQEQSQGSHEMSIRDWIKSQVVVANHDEKVLASFGLSKSEYKEIQNYYRYHIEGKQFYEPIHIRKGDVAPKLPRSIIYVPSGPEKGLYILCKNKGGIEEVGLGSFNRVTLLMHCSTGKEFVLRNTKQQYVSPQEIQANGLLRLIDPHGKHFMTGTFVFYTGPFRERASGDATRTLNSDKSNSPRAMNVPKIGVIQRRAPKGNLTDYVNWIHDENFRTWQKFPISLRLDLHYAHVRCMKIIRHLTEAVVKGHNEGVVNLDLKTDNILLDNQSDPLICDFGSMKTTGMQISSIVGSPGWISPEIAGLLKEGAASITVQPGNEMWIVGCIMAALTRGSAFFKWTGQQDGYFGNVLNTEKLNHVIKKMFPHFANRAHLDYAIARCLKYNPNDRMTAQQLREFLSNRTLISGINDELMGLEPSKLQPFTNSY